MARPRKYVNRHGRPVKTNTGVSFNTARRRFYIIRSDGKRQEFKSWEDARTALDAEHASSIPPEELSRIEAVARYRSDLAHQKLYADREIREQLNQVFVDGPIVIPAGTHAASVVRFAESAHSLADIAGVPKMNVAEDAGAVSTGPRLRDVIRRWKQHKSEEQGKVTQHHRAVEKYWNQFVKQAGDVFISELNPAHFRKFHSWVARAGAKWQSSQWQGDRLSRVKSVFRYVRRKYPEWPWPAGVLEWADSYDVKPHKPKASNREPMKPETFCVLVDQCRAWAGIDVADVDADTQSGRGRRLQAIRKKRDGVQFEAILRLGINCGLDPVDVERITWDCLRLDTAVSHMRFARRKIEGMTGEAIERITPLLPSTTEALMRWRKYDGLNSGPVFRTANKAGYTRNRVASTLRRLREEAEIEESATFKHLRNVGPTVAKRAKLSKDERDAFLGHVVDGASRFYEGDVDETFLVDLVNLIGEQYLGGEHVDSDASLTLR